MKDIEFHINKQENTILTNQYGLYSYKYHNQTGGPGFHSQFKFKVQPNYSGNPNSITLGFANTLNRFKSFIKNDYIFEGFKNGTSKFIDKLEEENLDISNPISIEIIDYQFHSVDSGKIYNQICFEQALNHIYRLEQLSPKTEFSIEYEEFDKIYIELDNPIGVKLNNKLFLWGSKQKELMNKINLPHTNNDQNNELKHFQGNKSINYSNTIIDRAYYFDIGFNNAEEFIELSLHIGFIVKAKELTINYCDQIDEITQTAKEYNYIFKNDGNGNHLCKELGIILSESSRQENKFGKGMIEYIYLTKPKPADNKV